MKASYWKSIILFIYILKIKEKIDFLTCNILKTYLRDQYL